MELKEALLQNPFLESASFVSFSTIRSVFATAGKSVRLPRAPLGGLSPRNLDDWAGAGMCTFSFAEFNTFDGKSTGNAHLGASAEAESSRSMRSKDAFTYVAKYVSKQGGDLHFGGTLSTVNFSEFRKSRRPYGRKQIVASPNLDWKFFHLNNPRRKK
jgi:hypothetical protein